MFKKPENWVGLSWQQRRDARFESWIDAEGVTLYDPEKMKSAWLKFVDEYDSDTFDGTTLFQAPVNDFLEANTMKWPGHGLPSIWQSRKISVP